MKKSLKKYYFFIGTEAELIKLLPVLHEFISKKIEFKIIASGQNNITQSDLLRLLHIKKVDIVLSKENIKQSAFHLFIWFTKTFTKSLFLLRKELKKVNKKEATMIVHGDTVSTLMGALLGKLFGIRIAHLEAGYRSFNLFHPFPEEIDRILVSYLADIHFCPYESAVHNIKNRRGIKINTFYNTIIDSLVFAFSQKIESRLLQRLTNKKYFIFILHRQENLFDKNLVTMLIKILLNYNSNLICIFVMHRLTQTTLEQLNLFNKIKKKTNIILSPRLPYIEFVRLLKSCEFIMTDSGSNQQETSYLGKPCLILRKFIEGVEGKDKNIILSHNDPYIIRTFIIDYKKYVTPIIIPKIKPSKIIVDYLISNQ